MHKKLKCQFCGLWLVHCKFLNSVGLGSILFWKRSKFSLKTVMKMQTELPLELQANWVHSTKYYTGVITRQVLHALRGCARQTWHTKSGRIQQLTSSRPFPLSLRAGCLGRWAAELLPSSCYEWVDWEMKMAGQVVTAAAAVHFFALQGIELLGWLAYLT